jgi:hypothetical protein
MEYPPKKPPKSATEMSARLNAASRELSENSAKLCGQSDRIIASAGIIRARKPAHKTEPYFDHSKDRDKGSFHAQAKHPNSD